MIMSSPSHRLAFCGLFLLCLCIALAGACYQPQPMEGYYACSEDADCAEGGLVCDDGVCCAERGEPLCLGRVLDGGTCADGGMATLFYRDLDEDGFGNLTEPIYRCAEPTTLRLVRNNEDCNDNPAAGGASTYPNAVEQCDGQDNDCDVDIDEGLDGGLWYSDIDQDGFGDPNDARTFCQRPPGWVASTGDCDPSNNRVFPGALEICNGVDDNCNGPKDDIPPQPCTLSRLEGVCAQGTRACRNDAGTCVQTVFPRREVCDSRDNDCDGTLDDKPECGGPVTFFSNPAVVVGAKYLRTSFDGEPPRCVKDDTAMQPADTVVGSRWRGAGFGAHVFWAESQDGGTWDLTRPNAELKLFVNFTSDGGTFGDPPKRWSPHRQPVVLLCAPGAFVRLVPNGTLLSGTEPLSIREVIRMPLPDGGGSNWSVGSGSSPDIHGVLRRVERVEVLIQPQSVSPTPSFQADFLADFGFP
jgi:hypothetical protein